MSRLVLVIVLVLVSCADAAAPTSTTAATTSTTVSAPTTAPSTTTTTMERAVRQLVKLDLATLEPVPGLDPFPFSFRSWTLSSTDGSLMVILERGSSPLVTRGLVIDVAAWTVLGEFEIGMREPQAVLHQSTFYAYNSLNGRVVAVDVETGIESPIGGWPRGLWFWDGLHVLPDGRLAGIGSGSEDVIDHMAQWSLYTIEPVSGDVVAVPFGPMSRETRETGVFEGDYEVPQWDEPGVAWGDDRVFVVHADGPEVLEVDLDAGVTRTHDFAAGSWLDRLLAYWIPAALAKGPSLGTYSSAVLSHDGRYLFISGIRHVVEEGAGGGLIEDSEPLGLTVIDVETWKAVESPDVAVQWLRPIPDGVLGSVTTSYHRHVTDNYLLSVAESGAVVSSEPITAFGDCLLATDERHLICFEYGSEVHLQSVDTETGVSAGRFIGIEDMLHPNGVLVVRPPTDPGW